MLTSSDIKRDMAIYNSHSDLSIRTFEATVISVAKFLFTSLVSEILRKDKEGYKHRANIRISIQKIHDVKTRRKFLSQQICLMLKSQTNVASVGSAVKSA